MPERYNFQMEEQRCFVPTQVGHESGPHNAALVVWGTTGASGNTISAYDRTSPMLSALRLMASSHCRRSSPLPGTISLQ